MASLNFDATRLKPSDSPFADSESGTSSNSATLEISPCNSEKHFYFPSGRISSNLGSFFDTDEDGSVRLSPNSRHLSGEDLLGLLPEEDKIISYEAVSPNSQPDYLGIILKAKTDNFDGARSNDSNRLTILQSIRTSTPELLEEFSPSMMRLSRTQNLTRTIALEQELDRLRRQLEENTNELDKVRHAFGRNFDDKETSTYDEDEELATCHEINELRKECLRYERQNEELRTELKYSAQDLNESEHIIRTLNRDLSHLKQKTGTYENEMKRCIRLMADMLNTDNAYVLDQSDDLHHLSNFLSSKVEIAKSRLNRMKTKHELATSEAKRLQTDNEKSRRLMKSIANEHAEATATLKQQLRASELKVARLEKELTANKLKLPSKDALPIKTQTTSIRIPDQFELETYIVRVKEAAEHYRSSRSPISSSPDSVRSSRQEDLTNKSVSLNESTREPSINAKHTKVISFTDELEGDKEQPKPSVKPPSTSPDRKKANAKPVQKYMLNGRGVMPRSSVDKTVVKRLQRLS